MGFKCCFSAALIGGTITHLVETKGLDFIDKEKAKKEGKTSCYFDQLRRLKCISISAAKHIDEITVKEYQS